MVIHGDEWWLMMANDGKWWWINGELMVINDDFTYPLVNVYVTVERSTMLLMGKSTK